jgi:hypothetical protein
MTLAGKLRGWRTVRQRDLGSMSVAENNPAVHA